MGSNGTLRTPNPLQDRENPSLDTRTGTIKLHLARSLPENLQTSARIIYPE